MANLIRRLERAEQAVPRPECPECGPGPYLHVMDERDNTPEAPVACPHCGRLPIVLTLQWATDWRQDVPMPEKISMPEAPPLLEVPLSPEAPPLPEVAPVPVAVSMDPSPLTAAEQADRRRAADMAACIAALQSPAGEDPSEPAPRLRWTLK